MLNVHNGTFQACGQIAAVSIVLGGPPPAFLEDVAYNMLVSQDVEATQLSTEKHLTKHEKQQLEAISNDPVANQDVILDHGYTGIIDASHVKDITGTVVVRLVTKRQLFLKEFRKGSDLYGLLGALDENKELCKKSVC